MRGAFASLVCLLAVLTLAGCEDASAPAATTGSEVPTATSEADVVMPLDAPPQEEPIAEAGTGSETACAVELGQTASARLVERCIAVSPATRPPCNAANPCTMIQGEIDRSCGMYEAGETRPAECTPSDVPAR